jgi:hypothetical protein
MSKLIYILLWFLIYFEYTNIGPLTLGQLWKLPLFLIGFIYLLAISASNNFKFSLRRILFLRLILFFIVLRLFIIEQNLSTVQFYINSIFFLLIFCFLEGKKINKIQLERFIYRLSVFLIISNIPFILGITQKTNAIELDRFGIEGERALSGLFYNVSVNYKILVFSTLFIFNKFLKKKSVFDFLTILLGFVFTLFTYTRLGIFSLLIGLFIVCYFHFQWSIKRLFVFLTLSFVLGFVIISSNELIKLRMVGGTTYRPNEDFDLNTFSSFRLLVNGAAIQQYADDSSSSIILGQGEERTVKRMSDLYGLNFIPHSKYLQYLNYTGLIGLLLILFEQKILYNFITRNKKNKYYPLMMSLFLIELIWHIPSHGSPFWSQLILGGVLYLNTKNENIINTL